MAQYRRRRLRLDAGQRGNTFEQHRPIRRPHHRNQLRSQGDDAILEGPCIDLSGAGQADLDLWYHMYGSGMGSLEVQVASSTGDSCAALGGFGSVFGVSGNQNNEWHEANVNLDAYTGGSVQIRIIGVRGSSYTSDIAIDDVAVEVTPAAP